jgi:hypothetical protein
MTTPQRPTSENEEQQQFDPRQIESIVDRPVAEGRMPTQERVNEVMQKARCQFRARAISECLSGRRR